MSQVVVSSRSVSRASRTAPRRQFVNPLSQTRFRLALGGAAIALFTLFVISQTVGVYDNASRLLANIVQTSAVRVDASEQALQHIAAVLTSTADALTPGRSDKDKQASLAQVYSEFQSFRAEIFTLRANQNGSNGALDQIEHTVYDQFWPQVTLAVADSQSSNADPDRLAFINADSSLEKSISPALQKIETDNFSIMTTDALRAGETIRAQTVGLGLFLTAFAALVTGLSFWLRTRIRRVFTPGIDLAMLLSWLVFFGVIGQFWGMPNQLHSMVNDAYYSVTASARVLALANQGNRAESGALLDTQNAARWQSDFDGYQHLIELRLCGQPGCLALRFTTGGDNPAADTVGSAKHITPANAQLIDGIVPLMANITFPGEAQTLETARLAYLDYLKIDAQTRQLLKANRLADAVTLNTGTQPGQSDEAFSRFADAIATERQINRNVFDSIWQNQQLGLTNSRLSLGILANVFTIGLLGAGVYHRFREL